MSNVLTEEQLALIDQIIAQGRYEDADQVIDEALRGLAEREQRLGQLRSKLRSGIEQIERGETHLFSSKWSDDRFEIAQKRAAAGDIPNPDVCP